MHLGNVFASLVAWLSTRSAGGRIVLRIEDLDPRTQSGPWADLLMDDLAWLGLTWDEGPFYQHDRIDAYQDAIEQLKQQGLLYPCFCSRAELHAASAPHASDGTPIYQGTCRDLSPEMAAERARHKAPATRLIVPAANDPAGTVAVTDRVYGTFQEVLARDCGDFLVRRSDGVFAYQLAVVIDDAAMGITEVVRGHDLLASTPRQVYLQRLLGLPTPSYAHVPLLLAADGRRLSKRDGDLDMGALRQRFGTPERLLGWLAYQTGLADSADPQSAQDLARSFSWERLRRHRDDLKLDLDTLPEETK